MLSDLNNISSNILILGDFNIDLLKINDKLLHKTYFDDMLSLGLSPAITLPTRVTEVSATLIDHIFTGVGGNNIHSSGIIISDISDHFPYFYSFYFNQTIKSPCNKFKYGRKYNDKNVSKILHSLENIDIINLMTFDNPDKNYDILETLLIQAIDRYMPMKKIRLNKYKHKKTEWITNGILKSIKFKDNLYKRMKLSVIGTVEHTVLKHNLSVYNSILKRLIRKAKNNYYYTRFEHCQHDSKNTWNMINKILNRSESKQFPDYVESANSHIADKHDIVNVFNDYFSHIGTKMASTITTTKNNNFFDYLSGNMNNVFKFTPVMVEQVKPIFLSLTLNPVLAMMGYLPSC